MLIFFFNDTATTEIYTLSLHDALPILRSRRPTGGREWRVRVVVCRAPRTLPNRRPSTTATRGKSPARDRKSTRLNSSHANISYAVFCLKKKTRTCSDNQTSYTHVNSNT